MIVLVYVFGCVLCVLYIMRVLVTGGAGFIGSHLCLRLLADGHQVISIDSLTSYYCKRLKLEAITKLANVGVVNYTVDITDMASLHGIFKSFSPEVVVHLAAQAGVRYSIDHPIECMHTNVQGTVSVLECCRNFHVHKVIIASSSSVYGVGAETPFSENRPSGQLVSPYAASKQAVEALGQSYQSLYKFPVLCLRFFTVYGPGGRPDMAVWKFIAAIEAGDQVPRFGDGQALREFTYIDDIIDGVVSGILRNEPGFSVVNLGGGSSHTVNELIEAIEQASGKSAKINTLPIQPGDVPLTAACQIRAQKMLGFTPKVSLQEGINRTVNWYREWLKQITIESETDAAETANTASSTPRGI